MNRILTILTILAIASVANAQSFSSATLQVFKQVDGTNSDANETRQERFIAPPLEPRHEVRSACDEQVWLVQTINDMMSAWQKLRSLCPVQAKNEIQCCPPNCIQATAKPAPHCCEAGTCKPSTAKRDCVVQLIGSPSPQEPVYRVFIVPADLAAPGKCEKSATPILDELLRELADWDWTGSDSHSLRWGTPPTRVYDLKYFIRHLPTSPANCATPAPCCCAKACACCESCKASKAQPNVPPMMPPAGVFVPQLIPPTVQTWTGPMPMPAPPMPINMVTPAKALPAHFVTPDFDGHCERITHRGDTVTLEGNVLLLCKKHAQPVRVEGERIIINLKDGSYTVDPRVNSISVTMPKNVIETKVSGRIWWQPQIAPTMEWATPNLVPAGPPMSYPKELFDRPARIIPVLPAPPTPPNSEANPTVQPARIIQVLPVPPHEHTPVERPR